MYKIDKIKGVYFRKRCKFLVHPQKKRGYNYDNFILTPLRSKKYRLYKKEDKNFEIFIKMHIL